MYDTLTKTKKFKRIKSVDTELLYRASENEYSAVEFHKLCNDKGATITVAHKDKDDRVFGGYTSKSWRNGQGTSTNDPNAFLFMIRPNIKVFGLSKEYKKDGTDAICHFSNFGPVFGKGTDFWIANHCQRRNDNGSTSQTYEFRNGEFGNNGAGMPKYFAIRDYEVFRVITE